MDPSFFNFSGFNRNYQLGETYELRDTLSFTLKITPSKPGSPLRAVSLLTTSQPCPITLSMGSGCRTRRRSI